MSEISTAVSSGGAADLQAPVKIQKTSNVQKMTRRGACTNGMPARHVRFLHVHRKSQDGSPLDWHPKGCPRRGITRDEDVFRQAGRQAGRQSGKQASRHVAEIENGKRVCGLHWDLRLENVAANFFLPSNTLARLRPM